MAARRITTRTSKQNGSYNITKTDHESKTVVFIVQPGRTELLRVELLVKKDGRVTLKAAEDATNIDLVLWDGKIEVGKSHDNLGLARVTTEEITASIN